MPNAIDAVLKEREKFLQRLRDESRRVAAESEKAADRDPDDLLARYVAKVDAAKRAKEEAIPLHDEEIAHYSALIKEVEAAVAAKDDDSYSYRPVEAEAKPRRAAARGAKRREK
jgi:hypothetical protein